VANDKENKTLCRSKAGGGLSGCLGEAIIMCIKEKVDIILVHNEKKHFIYLNEVRKTVERKP